MFSYSLKRPILFVMLFIACHSGKAQELKSPVNRKAVFAGSFYPEQKAALEAQLHSLFSKAGAGPTRGKVQTLIVPHAGYDYSGIVAASGYRTIAKDANYDNIFIIASSHREQFNGVSVYAVGNYETPLGEAKVNREVANTLIKGNDFFKYLPEAHDREHSIEVQIPYLQYHINQLPPIIPIVMGSSSVSAARELASALLPWFTPNNLFIISSDFSQYPSYEDAKRIDKISGDAILTKDPEIFYNALRNSSKESISNLSTPSCGWSSIMTMLYMAKRTENLEFTPVLYQNSGDFKIEDKNRVVGYWSIAGLKIPAEDVAFSLTKKDGESLLQISRATLESFLTSGTLSEISPAALSRALKVPAGAFVSLYMGGRLRGSIGSFSPEDPLYAVVESMTLAAALKDARFAPVEETELEYIQIEISVLTPLKRINSLDEFEPGRHGIYMIKDEKSGSFLPQVAQETGWSKEEFLGHCARDEAGIGWDGWREAELYIYEVIVFKENRVP